MHNLCICNTSVKPVDVDCISLIEEVTLKGRTLKCLMVTFQCKNYTPANVQTGAAGRLGSEE